MDALLVTFPSTIMMGAVVSKSRFITFSQLVNKHTSNVMYKREYIFFMA